MLKIPGRLAAIATLCLAIAPAQALDKVRFSINPRIYSYLPLMLAVDKGLFKAEGIEVEVITYGGSALSQIPMLARGDQDLAGMVTGPGFFNQKAGGFGIKLVASMAQAKKGWHDTMWVMVRQDLWDKGKVKSYKDLKGMKVEGGPQGSPVWLTSMHALRHADMTLKDVQWSERLRSVSDAIPLFKNNAIEVLTMVEPIVGALQANKLAVRWKPSWEVMPWFQESYLAANPKFLTEKRDVTKRFLKAFLKGVQIVCAGKGKWSDEMVASVVKWSKFPAKVIRSIPGPQHVCQAGLIDIASITRQQKIWMDAGMVKIKTPIKELVDTSLIDEVRKDMGIK
ncbi:MAG: ABC transporter substrate-binding protein [Bauldia litoralis]